MAWSKSKNHQSRSALPLFRHRNRHNRRQKFPPPTMDESLWLSNSEDDFVKMPRAISASSMVGGRKFLTAIVAVPVARTAAMLIVMMVFTFDHA